MATPAATGIEVLPGPVYVSDVSDGSDGTEITSSAASQTSSAIIRSDSSNSPFPFLRRTLDAIKPAGSFASFNSLSALKLGLTVPDVGTIAMPLQEPQARQIIEKARQAPYGKGEETVVDTSVRNTWELDADQFHLQGPEWERLLATVLANVAKSLGIASPIRAELYKMLLYEKGAMFKAHTDSPKIPGMFGTLVIVLPSPHQGGEVVLSHRGEKKVFQSSHVAQGFMSWYSDVQHEVLPVTQGYRWVLTYNMALVDPAAEAPIASRLGQEEVSHLCSAVQQWLDNGSGNPVYTLDHNYTEARLSLHALKGRDIAVVQALREISSKLPVDIYLAVLEQQDYGSCEDKGNYYDPYDKYGDFDDEDEDDDEDELESHGGGDDGFHSLVDIIDTEYRFKKLVDLDGSHLAENFVLHQKDLLVPGSFAKGSVEEIDYEEGYSGNEGVILVRRSSLSYFMLSALGNSRAFTNQCSLLAYSSSKCQDPSRDQSHLLLLKELCKYPCEPSSTFWSPKRLDPDLSTEIFRAAVRMKDFEFFNEAVDNLKNGFDGAFCKWIMGEVANGLPFADIKEPLRRAILSLPHLWQSLEAITTIASLSSSPQPGADASQEWALAALEDVLDSITLKKLDRSDGELLIFRCASCFDVEHIRTRVVPLVEKQAKDVSFILGILGYVAQRARSESSERESWLIVYEALAASLISAINIPSLTDKAEIMSPRPAKAARHYYDLYGALQAKSEPVPDLSSEIKSTWLTGFYTDLLSLLPSGHFATTLAQNICGAAGQLKPADLVHLWIPFLQQLVPVLEQNSVPLSTPEYQHLFVAVLDAYLHKYVRKEVTEDSRTLQRPAVSCGCGDCAGLNAFLVDPGRGLGRFSMNQQRRTHLEDKLRWAKIDCEVATERIGSPHTLLVNKTFKQHEAARRQWQSRKSEAEKVLRAFPKTTLSTILGAEYPRIIHMDDILWSAWKVNAPAAEVVVPESSVPLRGRPENKRKAEEDIEVVDLTELN